MVGAFKRKSHTTGLAVNILLHHYTLQKNLQYKVINIPCIPAYPITPYNSYITPHPNLKACVGIRYIPCIECYT